MSNPDNPLFRYIPEQFGPWLVSQVSSGKYLGLEWLNDKKTIFKIPWTKINYPMWEEHHKIFEAWAIHRGKATTETGEFEKSFSQIKSNFRTILKKCVEIEEVEDAHQLGLQMGNYKVYRILSNEESIAKRKMQQKTRKAYKLLKRMETEPEKSENVMLETDKDFLDSLKTKRKRRNKFSDDSPSTEKRGNLNDKPLASSNSTTRTISTQTYMSDTNDVSYLLEPAAFEETTVESLTYHNSTLKQNSVSTQVDVDSSSQPAEYPNVNISPIETEQNPIKDSSSALSSFQLLLEAACMAEGGSRPRVESPIKTPVVSLRRDSPSIADVLLELKISPSELFTYEMCIRYEARQVVTNMSLNDMSYGYRIHYNPKENRSSYEYINAKSRNVDDDQACTPISLPESSVPPGNHLYAVLRNIDNGLLVKSDQRHLLKAKRLCLSRVYAFTSYGETEADSEPMLLQRNHEVVLFSYNKFLKDWHRFLIQGSPKPNHEINLAIGKKTKHRHSRAFVSICLVPKAAETMLRKIAENLDEATLDNVLKLFNREYL